MRRTTAFSMPAVLIPAVLALGACSASTAPAASSKPSSTTATAVVATNPAVPATTQPTTNIGLTSDQLTSAIGTATQSATAVYVDGNVKNSLGKVTSIDAHLNADGTGSGSFGFGLGNEFPFIATSDTYYLQITSAVQKFMTGAVAADGFGSVPIGKWVSTPTSQSAAISSGKMQIDVSALLTTTFGSDVTFSGFLQDLTNGENDWSSAPDGSGTVAGKPVALYKIGDSTDGYLTLAVPATGPALPIEETGSSSGNAITITWNEPTTVTAPPANEVYSGS